MRARRASLDVPIPSVTSGRVSKVPSYLVESYLADTRSAIEEARERAKRAADLGVGVRYLRTTFLPGDEIVLHVFEARSAEALDEAGRRAALPDERIVEAVEGPAEPREEELR